LFLTFFILGVNTFCIYDFLHGEYFGVLALDQALPERWGLQGRPVRALCDA